MLKPIQRIIQRIDTFIDQKYLNVHVNKSKIDLQGCGEKSIEPLWNRVCMLVDKIYCANAEF